MKKLKTILCVLLSSVFLLFAGACNNTYDNGASQNYEDTTSNEFVNFSIYTDKTVGYGDKALVKIQYSIEVKREFSVKYSMTAEVTDLIFVVGLNDKYDAAYYNNRNTKGGGGLDLEDRLNGAFLPDSGGAALTDIKCEVGSTYGDTFYAQRYHSKSIQAMAGKYRLYLAIFFLYAKPVIVDGEVQKEAVKSESYLIPTDIVLDMQ